jgi:hypothetical protein
MWDCIPLSMIAGCVNLVPDFSSAGGSLDGDGFTILWYGSEAV